MGASSNFNVKLMGPNQNKILKVEYPSKHRLDLPQNQNLSLGNQPKLEDCLKRRPPKNIKSGIS